MFRSLIVAVAMIFSLSGFGVNVGSGKAGKLALNWYRHYAPASKKQAIITKTIPYRYNGRECFYIFSFDKGGFVLVSANDAVTPVLGYGFDHPVPDSITNEAVKGWFDNYARQIDTAFVLNLQSDASVSKWDEIMANRFAPVTGGSVGPLLTTTWDQGWPYNALCPEHPNGPGGHTWAGCVATAMAQIMKYWEWPTVGYDTLGYINQGYPCGYIGANFGNTTYNWQNMPNIITDTNFDVARIIFHAGVSVRSIYDSNETGAFTGSAPDGFVKCFKYAFSDIRWYFNLIEFFTDTEWDSIMHQELNSLRPILYRGEPLYTSGGHAFVCDGYADNGFYHFNFGWGGTMDGYYLRSNISPLNLSWAQGMVVGIKPNDGSTIFQNQEWSGNVEIHRNTIFLDSTNLTILPNTHITFDSKCSLRIAGTIQAGGTLNDSIVLTASDTACRWSGLSIEKGNWHEADSSFLTYTKIEYSDNGGLRINGIKNILISDCLIWKNKRYPYIAGNGAYWNAYEALGGGLSIHSSNADVRDSRFLHNWTYYGGGAIAVDGSCDSLNFIKNTIEYNHSQGKGGGVYIGGACEKVNVFQNTISECKSRSK